MNKIKTIIVEDEPRARDNLMKLLDKFCPEIEIIAAVESIDEAEKIYRSKTFDLALLDIQLGNKRIFDWLKSLDVINFQIVFVSAHNEALLAFEYSTIDYLIKPIDIEKLVIAVNKVKNVISNKEELIKARTNDISSDNINFNYSLNKIALPSSKGYELIEKDAVLYCQAEGSYSRIFLVDKSSRVVSQNLKWLEEKTKDFNFIRIHNSYLINPNFISYISKKTDGGMITMIDHKNLPISKYKRKFIYEQLNL